jgi:hypothetical protein
MFIVARAIFQLLILAAVTITGEIKVLQILFCLFLCFYPHQQLFIYLTSFTFTGDRAANLDLCLALTLLVGRVTLRATPAATRYLLFQGHIRKTRDSHF